MADTVSPSFGPGARVYPDGNAILRSGRQSGDTSDRFQETSDGRILTSDGTYPPYDHGADGHAVKTGELLLPRLQVTTAAALVSQRVHLHHFTARKTESITQVITETGGTDAGDSPSYSAIGIYTVPLDDTGTYTLVASSANDVTLWIAPSSVYTSPLQATWNKVAGTRYAVGFLHVNAGTMPNMNGPDTYGGLAQTVSGAFSIRVPRMAARLNGQTSLPASFLNSALSAGGASDMYQALLLP